MVPTEITETIKYSEVKLLDMLCLAAKDVVQTFIDKVSQSDTEGRCSTAVNKISLACFWPVHGVVQLDEFVS